MSAPLDALIADRLDITEAHARKLRTALLKELRSRAEEEGIRLPELGTFRMEDGDLAFSPSPSLRRLVNQQYEGLSSERLAGGDKPAEEDHSVPTLLDPPGQRSEMDAPPQDAGASASAESAEPDKPSDPGPTDDRSSVNEPDRTHQTPDYPIIEEEAEDGSRVAPEGFEEPSSGTSDPNLTNGPPNEDYGEPTDESRKPTAGPQTKSKDQERPVDSFALITGILLLALLGGIGWFVLNQTGVLPYPRDGTPPQSSREGPQSGQTAGTDTTARDTAQQSDAGQDQNTARFPGVTPGGDDQEPGTASSGGQWTIVVASTSDRPSAEAIENQYREEFDNTSLSLDIVESTVDGRIRYRVVVGQYSTEEAASNTMSSQSSRLPDGAWVLRLR